MYLPKYIITCRIIKKFQHLYRHILLCYNLGMKKIALVSHGCAKNLVDSELILGLLAQNGYEITLNEEDTDTVICKALYKTKFRSKYIIAKGDTSELNGLKVGDTLIVNEYGKIVGYYKESSRKES